MLRRLFFILPVLFGTLALLLLVSWNPSAPESAEEAPKRQVDFFMTGARSTQFEADGSLHSEMTSSKVEHLMDTEISLLDEPDLWFYRGYPKPWHVQSKKAEVSADGKQVELIEDVRISHRDEKDRNILITSSRMTLFPDTEYASTQAPVRIESPQGITSGTGMQAWLKDSRMNLLNSARGQYAAP